MFIEIQGIALIAKRSIFLSGTKIYFVDSCNLLKSGRDAHIHYTLMKCLYVLHIYFNFKINHGLYIKVLFLCCFIFFFFIKSHPLCNTHQKCITWKLFVLIQDFFLFLFLKSVSWILGHVYVTHTHTKCQALWHSVFREG